MNSTITSTPTHPGLQWAQHGQTVPEDSFTLHMQADQFVKTAASDFQDPDKAHAAAADSTAMKSQLEKQLSAAQSQIPATAAQAKSIALNVLMCGVFAGAIDTALHLALKQAPPIDIPTGSNPKVHAQVQDLCQQLSAVPAMVSAQTQQQGAGAMKQIVNMMRSQLDELVDGASQAAGRNDEAGRNQFTNQLGQIFAGGYYAGAAQANLGGHSL